MGIKRRMDFSGAGPGEMIEPIRIKGNLHLASGSSIDSRIELGYVYLLPPANRQADEYLEAIQTAVSTPLLPMEHMPLYDVMQTDELRVDGQCATGRVMSQKATYGQSC